MKNKIRIINLNTFKLIQMSTISTIPKIVHFVFGLLPQSEDFDLIYSIAIISAKFVLKPDEIMFWHHYEPKGMYWDIVKPFLTLKKINIPKTINKNNTFKNIIKHEHAADVIRLLVIKEFGGIYLDMDTICIRNIDFLLRHNAVMAEQLESGLCNAIILSKPESKFINVWCDNYFENFYPEGWIECSVILPKLISEKIESSEIKVLGPEYFFVPYCTDVPDIYDNPLIELSSNLHILHLWNNMGHENIKSYKDILHIIYDQSLYGKIFRFICKNNPQILPLYNIDNNKLNYKLINLKHLDILKNNSEENSNLVFTGVYNNKNNLDLIIKNIKFPRQKDWSSDLLVFTTNSAEINLIKRITIDKQDYSWNFYFPNIQVDFDLP